MFGYAIRFTGLPTALFGVLFLLTLVTATWMHITVVRMLHAGSPELANDFEHRADTDQPHHDTQGVH